MGIKDIVEKGFKSQNVVGICFQVFLKHSLEARGC